METIEKVLECFKCKNVRCKIVRDDRPDYSDFIAIFGYGELSREEIVEQIASNNLMCMFFESAIGKDIYDKNHKTKED